MFRNDESVYNRLLDVRSGARKTRQETVVQTVSLRRTN